VLGDQRAAALGFLAVGQRHLVLVMVVVVLAIWLVGAAVTKYSLEEMALFAPLAVVVVGATVGIVLLWVKIVLDSLRRRRGDV
jgi:uncharacterized membrane protein